MFLYQSVFLVTQKAAQMMVANKVESASIVNMASIAGKVSGKIYIHHSLCIAPI